MSSVIMGTVLTYALTAGLMSVKRTKMESELDDFSEGILNAHWLMQRRKKIPQNIFNLPENCAPIGLQQDEQIQLHDWIIRDNQPNAVCVDEEILKAVRFLSVREHMKDPRSPIVAVVRQKHQNHNF